MKRYFVDTNVVYSEFSDYEDAIQHYTALQDASVEGIITTEIKDYKYSETIRMVVFLIDSEMCS